MSTSFDRAWKYTGLAGVVVAFGGIAAAIAVAPWFTITGLALSDLGAPTRASAPLFNGALLLAGLLGGAFGVRVFLAAEHPVERAGATILAVALADQVLIGVFDITHPFHAPVSIAFFAGITYGWFVHGSGLALGGAVRRGVAVVWFGIAHVTIWIAWIALGTEGIAIPELVGALLLAAWVLDVTRH